MRKIIVAEFVTVDGVMEGPGSADDFKYAGWTEPYFNDEIGQIMGMTMSGSDDLLLGRVTYEGYANFFGPQKGGFADLMNGKHKYVVSNKLEKADWSNSEVIKGDVPSEIAKLKEKDGKDILVTGSATLVQTLVEHSLVDEFQLLLFPVVLGYGKRLFKDDTNTKLKLLESKSFESGVVLLRYAQEK